MINIQTVNWDEFIQDVETGDIVLMEGIHVGSRINQQLEGVEWSHSAMLIRAKDIKPYLEFDVPVDDEEVLCWESNFDVNAKPVYKPEGKATGPMLNKLQDRIFVNYNRKADSNFAIRHLYTERSEAMFRTIAETIKELYGYTFTNPESSELSNFLQGRFYGIQIPPKGETKQGLFCAQCLSRTFMNLGLVSTSHPDNSYAPVDYSEELTLPLLKRARFGVEINLDSSVIPKLSAYQDFSGNCASEHES